MDIYQHFRKDEEPFINQMIAWKEQVERSFIPRLTDFLDPRERQIVETIIGMNDEELKLFSSGGSAYAERQRMVMAPIYEEVTEESYQITLLEGTYHEKFVSLTHRDVMGAFLSLGVKREKLGDIFVADGIVQILLATEINPFIKMNLTSIKNANITLRERPLTEAKLPRPNWKESVKTVSSLRLDTVLKEIYRMSRKDAQLAIERELVKVNHKIIQDNKFSLEAGDLLSLRGKGRSKLVKIEGQTRKGNWRIVTATLD